ncbi:MAG: hypothetical protein PCFJNLEI_03726 [Verrucomicrobiae bacterium]|nr:hypothetical protein [Verrucomicrobiae bacterium]
MAGAISARNGSAPLLKMNADDHQPLSAFCSPVIPYERYVWDTPASPTELAQRLEKITGSDRTYRGRVQATGFEVQRVITYRNSFVPVAAGRFLPGPQGTRVIMSLRVSGGTAVLLGFWLTVVGRFLGLELGRGNWGLIPLGMLLFTAVMVVAAYKTEAKIARRELGELLTHR